MTTVGFSTIIPFVGLFVLFMVLGFYGKYWRRGNLNDTHEWSLGGRKLGTTLVFFLIGADIYTAFAFVAIPSGVFAKGSLYFFAIPYGALTFGVALVIMRKLWVLSKARFTFLLFHMGRSHSEWRLLSCHGFGLYQKKKDTSLLLIL